MSIENFVKQQMNNREARLRSPGFQTEMANEKVRFNEQLGRVGDSALDFVYSGIMKEILGGTITSTAKLAFTKKYELDDFMKDGTKAVLKTAGMGMRTMWEIARATGRGSKIALRHIFAR